jgi:hypothetical protein
MSHRSQAAAWNDINSSVSPVSIANTHEAAADFTAVAGGSLSGAWGAGAPQPWDESLLPRYCGWNDQLSRDLRLNGSQKLRTLFLKLRTAHNARLTYFGASRSQALFQRMQGSGVAFGAYGVDYAPYYRSRDHSQGSVGDDEDVSNSQMLLTAGFVEKRDALSGTDRVIWDADRRLVQSSRRRPLAEGHSLASLSQQLRTHGYARVRNWGFDMAALEEQCRRGLAQTRAGGATDVPIPDLQAFLNNKSVAELIRSYLGDKVRYDGHVVKVTAGVWSAQTMKGFPAGRWHHDRCGRRLKLFIYITDVNATNHPTQIAAATHNTAYYTHETVFFDLSRYSDEAVRTHHRIRAMHGPRGGGFIFDSNALHKIEMNGSAPRMVLTLEFHPHRKLLGIHDKYSACPSRRKVFSGLFRNNATSWLHGEFGYPLYPPEMR